MVVTVILLVLNSFSSHIMHHSVGNVNSFFVKSSLVPACDRRCFSVALSLLISIKHFTKS